MDHATATNIVRDAWQRVHGRPGTDGEILLSQAVAALETGYGRIGQHGKMAAQGMYNWGNIERRPNADGSCPTGYALGVDEGQVCFRVYPSDLEAAVGFLQVLTNSKSSAAFQERTNNVLRALRDEPTPHALAWAMRNPPQVAYYTGRGATVEDRINDYAKAIDNQLKAILGGRPFPYPEPEPTKKFPISAVALFALMGAGAWWFTHKRGR